MGYKRGEEKSVQCCYSFLQPPFGLKIHSGVCGFVLQKRDNVAGENKKATAVGSEALKNDL